MSRNFWGIAVALVVVVAIATLVTPNFLSGRNLETLLYRTSLFGIISLGAAFVIVTGGIDLSIGSVICLVGLGLPLLSVEYGWPVLVALPAVVGASVLIGLFHGVLVTRLALQPFVVTLCGLLLYRGIARGVTKDQTVGFGGDDSLRWLVNHRLPGFGDFEPRLPVLILGIIALAAGLFFHRTVYGRWLLALGRNREAARLSGIPTARLIAGAYVICAVLAGLGGILFVLNSNGGKASSLGNFYELYAIAGAVLGGCSLRGGEISVAGVVLGAGMMQVLRSAITQSEFATEIEFAVVGGVILAWVVAEELLRRAVWRRRRG